MADQYLVFPGVNEPSTSTAADAVVVPLLSNRSEKLFQVLNSIPDVVESDQESDTDGNTSLVVLRNVDPSTHPPRRTHLLEMTDCLSNLDQLSFSLERIIVQKLDQIDAREMEINEELLDIQKLIDVEKSSYNKNSINCFGMPYFKTIDLQPFPPNVDYLNKKRKDELISYELPTSHFWSANDTETIENAVKSELIEREIEKLKLKLNSTMSDPEERKQEVQKVWTKLNSTPIAELLTDNKQDFDWFKIAAYHFRDRHSPEECKRMWYLYAKPSVMKCQWTKGEDAKMKDIAKAKNYQDWEAIAAELGTGRSGYQCFVHYKMRLAPVKKIGKWTDEEDKLLSKIVEQCRIGPYVPWSKVMYYFENRSLRQVFNRWNYSLNPSLKKGHFTRSEDFGLCVGVSLYGKNFNKIASILGNRSAAQIRERYKAKMNDSNSGSWAKEEDVKLIELYNKYGDKKWSQISKHLSRDRTQCRLRYKRLKNKYNFNLDIIKRNVQYKPLHAYEKAWFKQYFTSGKDEKTLQAVSRNLSLIKKRGRKGKSGTQIENQLVDFFSESFTDPNVHVFKNVNIQDGAKLEEAAEVIIKLLKLFRANLCFPKNISENYIRSRDTNILANECLIKLIMLVAKSYNAEEGTTSYNNFTVDAENNFEEIDEPIDEPECIVDIIPEKYIDYDPSRFVGWQINFEQPWPKSYNRASMSSLIYGNINEFYVEPLCLDSRETDPIAIPAESVGFSLEQPADESPSKNKTASVTIPPKNKTQIDYLVPPSASSMVALRTYMLARKKLWKMIGKNEIRERYLRPKPLSNASRKKLSPPEAHDLAISRVTSLLFWPLFLSAHRPSKFGFSKLSEKCNQVSSAGSDAEIEDDIFVKPGEKPKKTLKVEKKNSVVFQAKLKQLRKAAQKKKALNTNEQKDCAPVFVSCDASSSTSKSISKPSASVSPSKKTAVLKGKWKQKGIIDPLSISSSELEESNEKIRSETKDCTDPQQSTSKTRPKRKSPQMSGVRRSSRFKQIKVEEAETSEPVL